MNKMNVAPNRIPVKPPEFKESEQIYHIHCLHPSCRYSELKLASREIAERRASIHHYSNPGHAVRIAFDLLNIVITTIR